MSHSRQMAGFRVFLDHGWWCRKSLRARHAHACNTPPHTNKHPKLRMTELNCSFPNNVEHPVVAMNGITTKNVGLFMGPPEVQASRVIRTAFTLVWVFAKHSEHGAFPLKTRSFRLSAG